MSYLEDKKKLKQESVILTKKIVIATRRRLLDLKTLDRFNLYLSTFTCCSTQKCTTTPSWYLKILRRPIYLVCTKVIKVEILLI